MLFTSEEFKKFFNFYTFWSYAANTGSHTKNCIFEQFILKWIKYTLERRPEIPAEYELDRTQR